MRKYTFNFNGKEEIIEHKSYAGVFRGFWNMLIKLDVYKTMEVIERAGIRISYDEVFTAKNGSKKKNIPIEGGTFVYTHLTPQAMEKVYEKMDKYWHMDEKQIAEQEKAEKDKKVEAEKEAEVKEEEKDLTPQQKAARTKARKKKEKEEKLAAIKAKKEEGAKT